MVILRGAGIFKKQLAHEYSYTHVVVNIDPTV